MLAAKFIGIDRIDYSEDLRKYIEKEVCFSMSLDNEFIMKMEDECFIA